MKRKRIPGVRLHDLRLQVRGFPRELYATIKASAKRQRIPIAEWMIHAVILKLAYDRRLREQREEYRKLLSGYRRNRVR
jgi:hypothetical protein